MIFIKILLSAAFATENRSDHEPYWVPPESTIPLPFGLPSLPATPPILPSASPNPVPPPPGQPAPHFTPLIFPPAPPPFFPSDWEYNPEAFNYAIQVSWGHICMAYEYYMSCQYGSYPIAPVQSDEINYPITEGQTDDIDPINEVQSDDISDPLFANDPSTWCNEFITACITQEKGSEEAQQLLASQSTAKNRIVGFFNCLKIEEISSLSKDKHANFVMIAVMKHADIDVIKRFMGILKDNPESIVDIGANDMSQKVIGMLIIRIVKEHTNEEGQVEEDKVEEFLKFIRFDSSDKNLLSYSNRFSPYLIQQVIKHVPNYKKALVEEINKFSNTEDISFAYASNILGMYTLEELEPRISRRATEIVNDQARIKNPKKPFVDWHQINKNTKINSTPHYVNGLDRKAEIKRQTRKKRKKNNNVALMQP